MNEIVVTFIRAAATEYAQGVRQFSLFGMRPGDAYYDTYLAAQAIRFPFPLMTRKRCSTAA